MKKLLPILAILFMLTGCSIQIERKVHPSPDVVHVYRGPIRVGQHYHYDLIKAHKKEYMTDIVVIIGLDPKHDRLRIRYGNQKRWVDHNEFRRHATPAMGREFRD